MMQTKKQRSLRRGSVRPGAGTATVVAALDLAVAIVIVAAAPAIVREATMQGARAAAATVQSPARDATPPTHLPVTLHSYPTPTAALPSSTCPRDSLRLLRTLAGVQRYRRR